MLMCPHFSRCGSQSQVEFLITSGEHMWAEMLPEQIVHNSDNVTANILHAGVYEAPFPPAPPVTVVYSLCTVTTKLCSDMSFLGSCRCGRDRALPRPSHRGGVLSRMWRHVSSPSHALLVSRQLCLIVIVMAGQVFVAVGSAILRASRLSRVGRNQHRHRGEGVLEV